MIKEPQQVLNGVIRQKWALQAPVILVAFAVADEAWVRSYDKVNYAMVDVAIVFDHVILAATAEQLATCWIAANDPKDIEKALEVPDTWTYVALTPLGYPDEQRTEPKKKPLTEIVIPYSK